MHKLFCFPNRLSEHKCDYCPVNRLTVQKHTDTYEKKAGGIKRLKSLTLSASTSFRLMMMMGSAALLQPNRKQTHSPPCSPFNMPRTKCAHFPWDDMQRSMLCLTADDLWMLNMSAHLKWEAYPALTPRSNPRLSMPVQSRNRDKLAEERGLFVECGGGDCSSSTYLLLNMFMHTQAKTPSQPHTVWNRFFLLQPRPHPNVF